MKLIFNSQQRSLSNDSDVDITPMLDVVFIMLIFFIVVATFVKESGIDLNKPLSDLNTSPAVPPIVVNINEMNEISVQNHMIPQTALRATIVRMQAEQPSASVVIRVHPLSKTKAMISAVDQLRSANVELPPVSLLRT